MNDFKIIDDVMPDVPPPAAGTVAGARARAFRPHRSGRRFPAWAGVLVAATATVAVIGTAVAVPLLGDGADGRAGDGVTATATALSADPSAEEVLDAVADRLARRQEPERAHWRVEMDRFVRLSFDGGKFLVEERGREVRWAGPDGPTVIVVSSVGAEPLTAADRAAWEKAGSPRICGADSDCDNDQIPYGRTRYIPHLPQDYGLSSVQLTPQELRELPQDPAELKEEILERWAAALKDIENSDTPAGGNTPSDDEKVWWVGTGLLIETPATPQTRAAALRMLSALPDVRITDGSRDVEGRAGLALTRETGGPYAERIVIDRATGDPLALEEVLTAPVPNLKGLPAGSVAFSRLVRRIGWTDEAPVLPEGCTPRAKKECLR
ncbi:hypothetical protein GCM10010156_34510 [Planobispora rosea]|uniref:CU044_5270 family protein n=1 Tax=Planobispora rosea TaxID=35762 RepID=A0A8J3S353_PLARO|nr:CU044_5270 family protein [Planobispora rosea]GGS72729.1 hypothetical protein GCM10010156_34510 [Planobispora rosea]GIH85315.1 hypothetical protein Pro02_37230 [Planobispora rosea]